MLCRCLELMWAEGRLRPRPVTHLSLLFHTWSAPVQSPLVTEHQQQPLPPSPFSHPPLLPHLPSPWRLSWRAAWPPWTGFLSWPCRRQSARRMPRMPTGQAWARRALYWILTPHWTRKRCSSTRTANRHTAMPVSSHLPSIARQRRRWHWARSTSGSVTTFPTTGRRAVAGR